MLGNTPVTAVVATTDLDRARDFYAGTLGLTASQAPVPEGAGAVVYQCGGDTKLLVYLRPTAGDSAATCASFHVDDVPGMVERMRGSGITFEEYDMEGLKTEIGIVTVDDFQAAWFKDPDGNILCVSN